MLKIEENKGNITVEFEGSSKEMLADMCLTMSAILDGAKTHMTTEYYMIMLNAFTLNIQKEVQDIENKVGAFSFFNQSE